MGDSEFTIIIGKESVYQGFYNLSDWLQGIKARDKYSEHNGIQEMLLSWALLEETIRGQTPSNQEMTVDTTEKGLLVSIECI